MKSPFIVNMTPSSIIPDLLKGAGGLQVNLAQPFVQSNKISKREMTETTQSLGTDGVGRKGAGNKAFKE